ncbi:MAG: LCP family protein [Ktedonobacteraceae bacterium]
MKRQFEPSDTSQGTEHHSEQLSPFDGWLTTDAHPGIPSAQPQENPFPRVIGRPAGKGLLSSWRSGEFQRSNGIRNPAPSPIIEQETLKQPAVQGSITDNGQTFSWGQVLPYQSGVTPSSALLPETQTRQPIASQPLLPMAPMAGPTRSEPLQPFGPASIPGQSQPPWQAMGFQGGGPPLVQGRPIQRPGYGSQSNSPRKKGRFPMWARVTVALSLVILILVGSGSYYYYANFAAPVSNITGQTITRIRGDDNPNQGRDTTSTRDILSGRRINILLLGSDTDQKFQGGYLAQTDIVVTIDPTTKSVGMLSIPRDTWLNAAAGKGMMKLDQVYYYGGPALSEATIHQDFGIYIDYYAWVGLNGFIKVIDTAGGVDIDVLHPITDDLYPDDTGNSRNAYAYKRLYLAPGPQHLDGPTALEYVRSRHADLVGDFGRSARQQQVLNQLKTKLDNPEIIGKLSELAQDLNGFVKTDMHLADVFKLMNLARTVDQTKINRLILDTNYARVENLQTSSGSQSVVILNCDKVRQKIAQMFALGNNSVCDTGISSNGTPTVASVSQPSLSSSSEASVNDVWQTAQQLANINTMNLNNGGKDLFGIRSLLDLMLLVVFESPAALQT